MEAVVPDLVRVRFLGTAPELAVQLGRRVQPGEIVGIPRDVWEGFGWSPDVWQLEPEPRGAKSKAEEK